MADGRQRVEMSKAAAKATSQTAGGATVVNSADATLTLLVDAADVANYAVGKEYSLAIT